jgi:hypothetical protein
MCSVVLCVSKQDSIAPFGSSSELCKYGSAAVTRNCGRVSVTTRSVWGRATGVGRK